MITSSVASAVIARRCLLACFLFSVSSLLFSCFATRLTENDEWKLDWTTIIKLTTSKLFCYLTAAFLTHCVYCAVVCECGNAL